MVPTWLLVRSQYAVRTPLTSLKLGVVLKVLERALKGYAQKELAVEAAVLEAKQHSAEWAIDCGYLPPSCSIPLRVCGKWSRLVGVVRSGQADFC
jgi:hypothetical protein